MNLPAPTPQLTPAEAVDLIEQGAVLLDVREDEEWQAGHAPQAIHIPLGRLGAALARFDVATPIVIICRSGHRSDYAATALREVGYDASNLSGGMHAWQYAGGSVVTSEGEAGSVI